MANIGWCTRLGWFNGFRLLIAANPEGVITGFGFGEGSAKDQSLTETMLALRQQAESPILSVGRPALGPYVVDTGFEGEENHRRWRLLYQAEIICKPKSSSRKAWSKAWRRWLHSIRQMVETVYAKLHEGRVEARIIKSWHAGPVAGGRGKGVTEDGKAHLV